MKGGARQLALCLMLAACSQPAPRASVNGTRPLDAWYGLFYEPLENGTTDVELLVLFSDPRWSCSADAGGGFDAVTFVFPMRGAGKVTSTVLARSGPTFGPTSGGSGEVRLTSVDDRYQGDGPTGPLVDPGGHVSGSVYFDLGDNLLIEGDFRAPHCALIDFRNAS